MLVARRLAGAENPSRQTVSYWGYTALGGELRQFSGAFEIAVKLKETASPFFTFPGKKIQRRTAVKNTAGPLG